MNGAGEHAFFGPAIAAEQDCGVARCRLERERQCLLHGGHLGLQVGFGDDRTHLFLELFDMRLQPPHFPHAIEHEADLGGREGLGQIVDGPAAHGFDGRLDRGIRRDGDDRQPGSQSQQDRQHIEPVLLSQSEIKKHDVEEHVADKFLGLRGVAGFEVTRWPIVLSANRSDFLQAHFIVDQQDIHALAPIARLAETGVIR